MFFCLLLAMPLCTSIYMCLVIICWERTLFAIARLPKILRILGECLLIPSLPGKALRTLVDIARLAEM